MFGGQVLHVRLVALTLALTMVSLCQSASGKVRPVMSNREARKAATIILEATAPPGFSPTEFTVRISVGADGAVKHVSNSDSLPEPLFAAAAKTARQWRFPSVRDGGPGAVLHFVPNDGFQPQSLVVTTEMSTLKVTLDSESNRLSLGVCSEPELNFERIGWGKYDLQFDVPLHDVRLIRGKADVDYIVQIVKAIHGEDRVEFWFGPYAIDSTPDDEQYVESETFATRNVVIPPGLVRGSKGGVIGTDTWGRLPNGKMWRQIAVVGEGARYRDVSPEDAALFDQIINSACWSPTPEN